jgi:hypothetical protein
MTEFGAPETRHRFECSASMIEYRVLAVRRGSRSFASCNASLLADNMVVYMMFPMLILYHCSLRRQTELSRPVPSGLVVSKLKRVRPKRSVLPSEQSSGINEALGGITEIPLCAVCTPQGSESAQTRSKNPEFELHGPRTDLRTIYGRCRHMRC